MASKCCRRNQQQRTWRDEFVLLAPAVAVLTVVSSQTRFTDHFRYVLPAFPFFLIWAGQAATTAVASNRCLRVAVVALATWSITSCLFTFPHTLSYFNELAGGPGKGDAHLLGSNLDWGQDLLYFKRWRDQHPEAEPLHLAYWGALDPRSIGIAYRLPPPKPTAGWHAVSMNILKGRPWRIRLKDGRATNRLGRRYLYFQDFQPSARAGYSIIIFHIDAIDLVQTPTSPDESSN